LRERGKEERKTAPTETLKGRKKKGVIIVLWGKRRKKRSLRGGKEGIRRRLIAPRDFLLGQMESGIANAFLLDRYAEKIGKEIPRKAHEANRFFAAGKKKKGKRKKGKKKERRKRKNGALIAKLKKGKVLPKNFAKGKRKIKKRHQEKKKKKS